MEVHFSSADRTWETPQDFFDDLNVEFGFTMDVCAEPHTAKCARYITPEQDFFKTDTAGEICWMNPPYGEPEMPCRQPYEKCTKQRCQPCNEKCKPGCSKHRGHHIDEYIPGIIDFMRRAYEESLRGALYVCLIPSRTDTEWWHEYAMRSSDIRYHRGRLRFGDAKHYAPFPSAVVVFYPYGSSMEGTAA